MPLVVYWVYGLIEGSVWSTFLVVGWPTEVESNVSDVVSGMFECLAAVAAGGVKALIKSVSSLNSTIKADYSATGGGTVNIPSAV